jgi:hypothetical protein
MSRGVPRDPDDQLGSEASTPLAPTSANVLEERE